jgi:hypothetical protein
MSDFNFSKIKADVAAADVVIASFESLSQIIFSIMSSRFYIHCSINSRQDTSENGKFIVVQRKINGGSSSSRKTTRLRVNEVHIRSSLIASCLDASIAGQDYSAIIESALAYDDTLLASVSDRFKHLKVNEAFLACDSTKKSLDLINGLASKQTLDDLQSIIDRNENVIAEFNNFRSATLSGLSVINHDLAATWSLYSISQRRPKPSALAKYQHQLFDELAWLYKHASRAYE